MFTSSIRTSVLPFSRKDVLQDDDNASVGSDW